MPQRPFVSFPGTFEVKLFNVCKGVCTYIYIYIDKKRFIIFK